MNEVLKSLETLYEAVLPSVKQNLETDQNLVPVVFIAMPAEGSVQRIGVAALAHEDQEDKHQMFALLCRKAVEAKAIGLVAFADTWVSRVKITQGDPPSLPSELVKRTEAVVAMLVARTGILRSVIHHYHREGDVIVWDEVEDLAEGVQAYSPLFQEFSRGVS